MFLCFPKTNIPLKSTCFVRFWNVSAQSHLHICIPALYLLSVSYVVDDAGYPHIHLFKIEEAWDHTAPKEECSGPLFKKMQVREGTAIISFHNSSGPHFADILPDGSLSPAGEDSMARYLYIAGADGAFHPAYPFATSK